MKCCFYYVSFSRRKIIYFISFALGFHLVKQHNNCTESCNSRKNYVRRTYRIIIIIARVARV